MTADKCIQQQQRPPPDIQQGNSSALVVSGVPGEQDPPKDQVPPEVHCAVGEPPYPWAQVGRQNPPYSWLVQLE